MVVDKNGCTLQEYFAELFVIIKAHLIHMNDVEIMCEIIRIHDLWSADDFRDLILEKE